MLKCLFGLIVMYGILVSVKVLIEVDRRYDDDFE